MKIIVDSREQLPLNFKGHELIKRKLDEGDYATPELEHYLVIERKGSQDFFGSLMQGHNRFMDELLRARLKGKRVYIFVECTKQSFLTGNYRGGWFRKVKPAQLAKMIATIEEKYQPIILFCDGREDMEMKILLTFDLWNKKLGEVE